MTVRINMNGSGDVSLPDRFGGEIFLGVLDDGAVSGVSEKARSRAA